MIRKVLVDTDIIIDYLRGREPAVSYLEGLDGPLLVSAITVAELYSGVRGGKEEQVLQSFLEAFTVLPVTRDIAAQAGLLRRDFHKSHGMGLADAVIAATAQQTGALLATLNQKHYPGLKDKVTPYTK